MTEFLKKPPHLKLKIDPKSEYREHHIADDTLEHCLAGIHYEAQMMIMHNDAEVHIANERSIPSSYIEALHNIMRLSLKTWDLLSDTTLDTLEKENHDLKCRIEQLSMELGHFISKGRCPKCAIRKCPRCSQMAIRVNIE